MKIKFTSNNHETTEIKLSGQDIIDLLRVSKPELFGDITTAKVTFRVPGGGDYSNMTLDIEESDPIHVRIDTVRNR